jgi:prepilin-type N-terminal cleavage/methylation domain-containing protein
VTPHPVRAYSRARRGFTLLELVVVIALAAVMVGTATSALSRRPYGAWAAQQQVMEAIRRARNDALTRGDHYALDVTGATTWAQYRLRQQGGAWVVDGPPVRHGALPDGTTFVTGIGSRFEFTTRGLMVTPAVATTLLLRETDSNTQRAVVVWPSGQLVGA